MVFLISFHFMKIILCFHFSTLIKITPWQLLKTCNFVIRAIKQASLLKKSTTLYHISVLHFFLPKFVVLDIYLFFQVRNTNCQLIPGKQNLIHLFSIIILSKTYFILLLGLTGLLAQLIFTKFSPQVLSLSQHPLLLARYQQHLLI